MIRAARARVSRRDLMRPTADEMAINVYPSEGNLTVDFRLVGQLFQRIRRRADVPTCEPVGNGAFRHVYGSWVPWDNTCDLIFVPQKSFQQLAVALVVVRLCLGLLEESGS